MRDLVRRVFSIISHTNPYLRTTYPAEEIRVLIEEHSDIYLNKFGLELCESVGVPIINLDYNPFNEKSNYFSFLELCKGAKARMKAYEDNISRNSNAGRSSENTKTFEECIKSCLPKSNIVKES